MFSEQVCATMTSIFILMSCLTVTQASTITYKNLERWPIDERWMGFKGSFTIQFASERSGWRAHLIFNKAVEYFEIFVANVIAVQNGNHEFVVQNKFYNHFVHRGQEIEMIVLGRVKGYFLPDGRGYIEKADKKSTKPSAHVSRERTSILRTTQTTTAVSLPFTSTQNSKSYYVQNPQNTLFPSTSTKLNIHNQSSKPLLATIQTAEVRNTTSVSCNICEDVYTSRCSSSFKKCNAVCMTHRSGGKLATKCASAFICRYHQILDHLNDGHTDCCKTNECFLRSISLAIQNNAPKTSTTRTTKHTVKLVTIGRRHDSV